MDRYDQNETNMPDWLDESIAFLLVLGSCMAVAYGVFKLAQMIGWLPDFWWTR